MKSKSSEILPPIPDKRYFTIGEASELCGVKPHVLRYWEQEFPQLCPAKRRGNRRYYQQKDLHIIRQIRHLLYEQGYTIVGAKMTLGAIKSKEEIPNTQSISIDNQQTIRDVIADLEGILEILKT